MIITRPLTLSCLALALLAACSTATIEQRKSVQQGQMIYAKECSQCHGTSGNGAGAASLGLGVAPPDLTGLTTRNDGAFPHEFVRRFVLGLIEKNDPDAAMPEFAKVGLPHVYPDGGADGEVLEAEFADLLVYLEAIQK